MDDGSRLTTEQQLKEAQELLLGIFIHVCGSKDGYDHMCVPIFTYTQDYLIQQGLIKPQECLYT